MPSVIEIMARALPLKSGGTLHSISIVYRFIAVSEGADLRFPMPLNVCVFFLNLYNLGIFLGVFFRNWF